VPVERFRCAADSVGRGEPLIGTASRVGSWVLVEQPGAWGSEALVESGLDPAVGRALLQRSKATGTRVLLIRRPGRAVDAAPRRAFLAHTGARSSWLESLELADAADLLALDWEVLQGSTPAGIGDAHPGGSASSAPTAATTPAAPTSADRSSGRSPTPGSTTCGRARTSAGTASPGTW
jgi:hypothetical protein